MVSEEFRNELKKVKVIGREIDLSIFAPEYIVPEETTIEDDDTIILILKKKRREKDVK